MGENYIPLYRKYRPQTLDTLVGQEHIKKTLKNAIETGRISHAYLFTGPRGTGKTSTARILAKSLNCVNGPTINPCGECPSCLDIKNSIPIDVIEIDAASNRKVEDTQNILEKIQYVPVNGKYKIYIIDEVHMLTNHAFNALLKTLEEPPENVVFILATTEVHKVLDTIKSRCQRFDFRRITTSDIVKHLRYISDNEKIKITEDALLTIAKNSAGGMRDSISLLDQLSLLGINNEITVDDVNSILGRISFDVLKKISDNIINSIPNKTIEICNEIYNSGNEPSQILSNLFEYYKNLLVVKTCDKNLLADLTGLNDIQIEELTKQSARLETQQITFLIEKISYYMKEIERTTSQYLWLEVAMIDLSNLTENTTLLDLQNRITALENSGVAYKTEMVNISNPASVKNIQKSTPEIKKEIDNTQKPEPVIAKNSNESKVYTGDNIWQKLLSNINSPSAQALLKLATPVKLDKDEIIITFKNERLVSQINDSNKKQLIIDSANLLFNQSSSNVIVRLASSEDKKNITTPADFEEKKNRKVEISSEIVSKIEPEKIETFNDVDNNEEDDIDSEEDIQKTVSAEKSLQSENIESDRIETEQEQMIIKLFDGKYVE